MPVLLEKFGQMSLFVTDDAIAKLYVRNTLVKSMVDRANFLTVHLKLSTKTIGKF